MEKISRYIDTSPLRPSMTEDEVKEAIEEGVKAECASVCVQPCHIPLAAKLCKGSKTAVCCVLDFPHGKSPLNVKEYMAKTYCELGANEIDMVMNYGYALSGLWDQVEDEIKAVVKASHEGGAIVKVIFEASQLSREQIIKATKVSISAGADFVKTATGFFGDGATEEEIRTMADAAEGKCKVKASGGIRSYEQARNMMKAGADRIGMGSSSLKKVLDEEKA